MIERPSDSHARLGQDLYGNTFWEFKDALNHDRWRRMVKASRRTHFSDVRISPQWHQWLRQTRLDPPTLQEQAAEVQRQAQLKHNARLADERWAAKARYIEKPSPGPTPQLTGDAQQDIKREEQSVSQPPSSEKARNAVGDPWKQARETGSNPSATWAPESWVPGATKR